MVDIVLENRKLAIIKYIECLKDIFKTYDSSHKLIISLNSFKPMGAIFAVEPKVLSALMTFGLVQNNNLEAIESILDDIFNKVIPFSRKYNPEYNIVELFEVINKLYLYRDNLILACNKQHNVSNFSYEEITDIEIRHIFSDMAKLIKSYEEGQFRMMAIHADYKDFFRYKQKTFLERIMDDNIKLSYELAFSICSYCNHVATGIYLAPITYFVEEGKSYKEHHSGHSNEVIIPRK
jgi:hypothetical protein